MTAKTARVAARHTDGDAIMGVDNIKTIFVKKQAALSIGEAKAGALEEVMRSTDTADVAQRIRSCFILVNAKPDVDVAAEHFRISVQTTQAIIWKANVRARAD